MLVEVLIECLVFSHVYGCGEKQVGQSAGRSRAFIHNEKVLMVVLPSENVKEKVILGVRQLISGLLLTR